MKKNIFKYISISLVFLITYVLFGVWGLIEINKNKSLLFKNKKDLLIKDRKDAGALKVKKEYLQKNYKTIC